jgi:hypothetical protein
MSASWQTFSEVITRDPFAIDTIPSGYLYFRAFVEAGFLVLSCRRDFGVEQRRALNSLIITACGGHDRSPDMESHLDRFILDLQTGLEDLRTGLENDLLQKTIELMSRHDDLDIRIEALHLAALAAYACGRMNQPERDVLAQLATGFDLPISSVDTALRAAEATLGPLPSPSTRARI